MEKYSVTRVSFFVSIFIFFFFHFCDGCFYERVRFIKLNI